MDAAAALVGFIGLSGQVLQGCNYLCEFFADAKDAPRIVRNVSDHLEIIQPALTTIHAIFSGLQEKPTFPPTLQNPTPALEHCESAIAELKAFVDRHDCVNASVSEISKLRKGWQRLGVARKSNKLRGLAVRLEQAKTSLLLVQANIDLALGQRQLTLAQQMKLAQEQLRDAHNTQTTFANESSSARLKTLEEYARETRASARVTEDAICSLSEDFTNKLGGLSRAMAPVIEKAVAAALAQHSATLKMPMERPENCSDWKLSVGGDQNNPAATKSTGQLDSNTSIVLQSNRSFANFELPTRESDCNESSFADFVVTRGPKRQRRNTTSVNLWFGRLQITTAVTEQEDHTASGGVEPLRLYAKRTQISILPNIWFLSTGACFQFGDSKPGIHHPMWDTRLRVFHTHSYESRVCQVMKLADYVQFREMLQYREVTVHDMIENKSLFEYVTQQLLEIEQDTTSPNSQRERVKHLFSIAQLLASSGTDVSYGRSLSNSLHAMHYSKEETLRDGMRSLARLIISQSEADPFNEWVAHSFKIYEIEEFVRITLHQEEWDLSEFKGLVQRKWGQDFWDYLMVVDRPRQYLEMSLWEEEQEPRWLQLPLSLRQDKEHCAKEFGEYFVREKWPQLSWRDQRPPFWRSLKACQEIFGARFMASEWGTLYWEIEVPLFWESREECRKFFGHFFVKYEWGELYWRVKRPTFWHSREACREFFGEYFIENSWRDLLQERSFDDVEGRGAWEWGREDADYYGYLWNDYNRSQWVSSMINRWQLEEEDLRHSREHCIEQYGTNFVREGLPKLLRDFDGLSEDEITALTHDGLDLVPPSPPTNLVRSEDDGSDCETDEEDGWETADES